ncbi:Hypothetical_protein [Hexamita inflata]|uniref:Hypothetical_protein n=1 Tax=Hexamita inflata TaxID=28002 RepID=A0AA86Q0A6_9EUKA|nr:Hypothetical protein HINF_LOCUS31822 [Hexamita inflata]
MIILSLTFSAYTFSINQNSIFVEGISSTKTSEFTIDTMIGTTQQTHKFVYDEQSLSYLCDSAIKNCTSTLIDIAKVTAHQCTHVNPAVSKASCTVLKSYYVSLTVDTITLTFDNASQTLKFEMGPTISGLYPQFNQVEDENSKQENTKVALQISTLGYYITFKQLATYPTAQMLAFTFTKNELASTYTQYDQLIKIFQLKTYKFEINLINTISVDISYNTVQTEGEIVITSSIPWKMIIIIVAVVLGVIILAVLAAVFFTCQKKAKEAYELRNPKVVKKEKITVARIDPSYGNPNLMSESVFAVQAIQQALKMETKQDAWIYKIEEMKGMYTNKVLDLKKLEDSLLGKVQIVEPQIEIAQEQIAEVQEVPAMKKEESFRLYPAHGNNNDDDNDEFERRAEEAAQAAADLASLKVIPQ